MKNFIKEVKLFILSNKILTLTFCIATVIFVSYEVTKDLPEIIPYGEFIFNLFSQLSLAFMGCFVFYIMQVYIPERKRKKVTNNILANKIEYILIRMIEPAQCITNSILKKNLDINNMDKTKFASLYKKDYLDKGTKTIFRGGKEYTHKDYIKENICEINNCIFEIYMTIGYNLDIDILDILSKIRDSKYNKIFIRESALEPGVYDFKKINETPVTVTMKEESFDKEKNRNEIIKEYYELYLSLRKYKRTL
ncbi:TPA: hypothetical protein STZ03_003682 [Clostridioides difficile]|uniref:hypothetical protein n=1 Tax=Clostridioides difficile TaxID=1496 RepID=UPI000D1DE034|nr:hypothetical protein [Clostridioides difficile]HBE9443338.1 hypothetical protein [Clostridioides difficile]HBG4838831.1 hypothetical protein [Clostridioides difficile]HEK4647595.1 hypothetical protein [Clostridioides difficile]HEK4927335.1 hypothetical protein [Clostridioides difficile]HEK5039550.1 hypothetical protein [Clostridioides difficile]